MELLQSFSIIHSETCFVKRNRDRLAANFDAGGGREAKRFLRVMSAL